MANSYRRKDINPAGKIGTVYLLHFEEKLKHAGHYIGFTERPVTERLGEHWSGNGSSLTAAVHKAGIKMVLARLWENVDQSQEMILKCRAESPALCPMCNDGAFGLAS